MSVRIIHAHTAVYAKTRSTTMSVSVLLDGMERIVKTVCTRLTSITLILMYFVHSKFGFPVVISEKTVNWVSCGDNRKDSSLGFLWSY
jgi:hypothetical protein